MPTKDFTTDTPILQTLREQIYTSTAIISELSPLYAEYLKKPASTEKDMVAKELFANEALPLNLIYNHKVNSKQTFIEQQIEKRRPRLSIYKDIIQKNSMTADD